MDLRGAARAPGDVSPRERDTAMFLEALLATRERLVLSYVCRDALTGEALPPSSTLIELMGALQQGYLGLSDDAMREWVVTHPLRRWDRRYFPDLFPAAAGRALPSVMPEARREAQAAALAADLRAAGGQPGERRALAAALPARVREHLRLAAPPAPPAPEAAPPATLRVPLATLRRFLECPLQGYASYWLRLAEDEEDPFATADEPFAVALPGEVRLLRGALGDALVQGRDPLAEYERRADLLELTGALPTGLFGAVERARLRRRLETWLAQVPAGPIETVRFGGAQEHAVVGARRDPLLVDLTLDAPGLPPALRVEITGRTEPLADAHRTSLVFSVRGDPGDEADLAKTLKQALRGVLDHAILAAAGEGAGQPHVVHVCLQGDGGAVRFELQPFSAAEARAWLATLTTALVSRAHDYLLPCEAALLHFVRGGAGALVDCAREVLGWPFVSSKLGPITDLDAYAVPPEDEARAIVAARLGPMLARLPAPAAPKRGRRG
jgi:exodeoxyribonuclease V gamma subunit